MESKLHRVHQRTMLLEFLEGLAGIGRWIAIILVIRLAGGNSGISRADAIFALLGLLAFIKPLFTYYTVQFGLVGESFVYRASFLSKIEKVIPVDRIQEVEFQQPLLHRWLRLVKVKLDTAGGPSEEVEISALEMEDAEALRAEILRLKQGAGVTESRAQAAAMAAPETELWRASWHELVVAGLGRNRVWVIIGLAVTIGQQLGDSNSPVIAQTGNWLNTLGNPTTNPAGFGILIFGLMMIGWILGIISAVIQHHGFVLTQSQDRLIRRSGLFTLVQRASPLSRMQALQTHATWMQQKLGFCEIKIGLAMAMKGQGNEDSDILCPMIESNLAPRMMRLVFPAMDDAPPRWQRPHPSYQWYQVWVWPVFFAILGAVAWFTLQAPAIPWIVGLAMVYSLVHTVMIRRALAFTIQEGHVYVRQGVLRRTLTVVPLRRCVFSEVTQGFFQRRKQLANVVVVTASTGVGSKLVLPHISMERALSLHQTVCEESHQADFGLSIASVSA